MTNPLPSAARHSRTSEPESLAQLRQDCTQVPEHWTSTGEATPRPQVAPSELHGIRVPERSARLLDGMSDYGD